MLGYLGMHMDNEPFMTARPPGVRLRHRQGSYRRCVLRYPPASPTVRTARPVRLPDQEPYGYDPDRAVNCWPKRVTRTASTPSSVHARLASVLPASRDIAGSRGQLPADVGINAELNTEEWGIYLENYLAGDYPIMLGWSADFADLTTSSPRSSPANAQGFGYDNPELFQMISDAQQAGTALSVRSSTS